MRLPIVIVLFVLAVLVAGGAGVALRVYLGDQATCEQAAGSEKQEIEKQIQALQAELETQKAVTESRHAELARVTAGNARRVGEAEAGLEDERGERAREVRALDLQLQSELPGFASQQQATVEEEPWYFDSSPQMSQMYRDAVWSDYMRTAAQRQRFETQLMYNQYLEQQLRLQPVYLTPHQSNLNKAKERQAIRKTIREADRRR